MAIVAIIRNQTMMWGKQRVMISPKPTSLRGRVKVEVPDEVVRRKEVQPVVDAYAKVVKRPEFAGKTLEELEEQHDLLLGFQVISFDDGAPVPVEEGIRHGKRVG